MRTERPSLAVDHSLARRIRDGDRGAEEELAERFRQRVYVMALARTRDPEAAKDLVQEVLLGVLRALRDGKLRAEERLSAFVHGTARNRVNDHLQARQKRQDGRSLPPRPPAASPEERFVQAERQVLVRRALRSLGARDQEILLLTLVEGLKPGEIAERLGLRPELVRKRKSRAVRKVRQTVSEMSRK